MRRSAGVLVHRRGADGGVEVLVGHMGGPFWARRDAGAWSIPKGEHDEAEDPFAAACREFTEELGQPVPPGEATSLGSVRQSGGKVVTVWTVEGDLDPATVVSNTFTIEWPRGTGVLRQFPELDRVAWLPLTEARDKLVRGQVPFLDRLLEALTAQRRRAE
jgi:predicted NUDIX family NTP pyrophosphohydrolase